MALKLTDEQQKQLDAFKEFVKEDFGTKGGYEVDKATPIAYMLLLNGQLIAKGKVLQVNAPGPVVESKPTTILVDTIVYWNMNGQAFGNDMLTLVKTIS